MELHPYHCSESPEGELQIQIEMLKTLIIFYMMCYFKKGEREKRSKESYRSLVFLLLKRLTGQTLTRYCLNSCNPEDLQVAPQVEYRVFYKYSNKKRKS